MDRSPPPSPPAPPSGPPSGPPSVPPSGPPPASRLAGVLVALLLVAALLSGCVPANAVVASPEAFTWRTRWTTESAASEALELQLEPRVTGLDRPVALTPLPDGSDRLLVAEQAGRVRLVVGDELRDAPLLDLSGRVSCCHEQGLLDLAAHPDFADNGWLFVSYTDADGANVVARYRVQGERVDPASERLVLRVPQPGPVHNGGAIAFGPRGYLWVAVGDGDHRHQPDLSAESQRRDLLLGKLLRLDVDCDGGCLPGAGYAVPADNPFVGDPGTRDEIWALGLRNPWKFSFDPEDGALFLADVGQSSWEEVNVERPLAGGRNYGWPWFEGPECFGSGCEKAPVPDLAPPAFAYDHEQGCSISGGHVYRGASLPQLRGVYVYGDFCSGRVWGAQRRDGSWRSRLLFEAGVNISTFGVDARGELYLGDYGLGTLYRITADRK